MALTPFSKASFGSVRVVAKASPDLRIPALLTRAVYNTPVQSQEISAATLRVVDKSSPTMRVSAGLVRAIIRGKIKNPRLRAWTFTLDGHDFYVLKLGTEGKTLIFDLSTGQWGQWSSGGEERWRASLGLNWRSARRVPAQYGSSIIVGDDSYGALWVLDPTYGLDEHLLDGDPLTFPRVATAQIAATGRKAMPCFSAYLSASGGNSSTTPATVNLSYSDDAGHTFVTAGEISIVDAQYTQEFAWRSLGQIRAPGRLFQISDNGALARIDSLDVNNENS